MYDLFIDLVQVKRSMNCLFNLSSKSPQSQSLPLRLQNVGPGTRTDATQSYKSLKIGA